MIRKLRIFLLFCFPSVCYADGVSVQAWTLASSPFAFLVKVIALDNTRFKAKVKIIKKFHSSINLTDQSPAIYPAAFFDRPDNVEVHTVSWNDLNLQSEFTLNLNRPTEAVAGKWVIEEQYWDQAEVPKIDSSAYIVANNRGTWTWVKTTPFTEKKFQLFYDLKQRDHELKSLSESKLLPWLKDEDLKSYALLELENRNAIGPKLFLTKELKEKYHWILRDYLDKKDNTTQKKVINTFYEYLLKEKVNELFIVNFLNLFNYLPPGLLSFDQEVQLGSLLKYQKNEGSSSFHPVNEAIKAIHRKIKDKAIGSHYIKVSEQILDAFKYESSPTIRPTDVYSAT